MAKLGKWKTIDSAPRDGTKFIGLLTFDDMVAYTVFAKYYNGNFICTWDHEPVESLTYWRPMVKLPKLGVLD
jgi:hypothetical protein